MKRILASLLMFCCIAASSMAQNEPDQYVDFQIVAQGHVDTPIYRSPAIIPVQGYYSSYLNTLYLSFTYDLGMVNVNIENEMTGESMFEVIPTDSGAQAIPLGFSSNGGVFTITLSIPNGLQYIAVLEL